MDGRKDGQTMNRQWSV